MEPLNEILEIYKDRQKVLLQFLPVETTKYLSNHEYVQDLETLFLNDRLILIKKSSGKIHKKGIVIKITNDKITLKTTMLFLYPKTIIIFFAFEKNNSQKNNRKFY